jgi:hypothetical protein
VYHAPTENSVHVAQLAEWRSLAAAWIAEDTGRTINDYEQQVEAKQTQPVQAKDPFKNVQGM